MKYFNLVHRLNQLVKQLSSSKRAFSAGNFDIIQVIYKPNQIAKSLKFSKQAIQAMKIEIFQVISWTESVRGKFSFFLHKHHEQAFLSKLQAIKA